MVTIERGLASAAKIDDVNPEDVICNDCLAESGTTSKRLSAVIGPSILILEHRLSYSLCVGQSWEIVHLWPSVISFGPFLTPPS